jgi:Na+-transporting NADH:ubiquinone oxidoreductase subunit NqrB
MGTMALPYGRVSRLDPRLYQIGVLTALLLVGLFWLEFDLTVAQAAVTIVTALLTQAAGARLVGEGTGVRSALISSLSLCLLLRTTDLGLAAAASVIAIGSKFVLRTGGKHLFNPTNLALVCLIALTSRAWVSPGQWGSPAFLGFLVACLGTVVVTRAARADVTFAFLGSYAALLLARAWWLGDPIAIPLHRLQNGAVLLFAFFMISDPKTTPDSRAGRIIFAVAVSLGAYYVHNVLFRTNGLLWSLAACSLAVPLLDRFLPGTRYQWSAGPSNLEVTHETLDDARPHPGPRVLVH